jgi:hypothetical protein
MVEIKNRKKRILKHVGIVIISINLMTFSPFNIHTTGQITVAEATKQVVLC